MTPQKQPLAFDTWLRQTSPTYNWDWPYLVEIRKHLDRITDGSLKRLAIFVPPRHGKSALATIRYPVYRLLCDPSLRIIIGCYNSMLAEKFSRQALRIAREAGVPLSRGPKAASDWETLSYGGLRAVGVGAGITGQGGSLIIIDDPVKSREEANSRSYRERVWDWFREDLYTRLEPGGAMVLIQCMTGDTPVTMADGSERHLADIRPGDEVAAWQNGRRVVRLVVNWAEQGEDDIYEVRAGKSRVRANARHPFLVMRDSGAQWVPVSQLAVGDLMVTASVFAGRQTATLTETDAEFRLVPLRSVKMAGREKVYDLQVEDAECFFADGLVSHNTRWHEDDLAGRILASEQAGEWTVISFPAEADENDPLGRQPGEPLCPDRFDIAALADIKATLGTWAFTALYQQRPLPVGGGLFRRDWLPIVEAAPVQARRIRYWDKAGSSGAGDYSVGVRMAKTADGLYYVEDVVRGQWSAFERSRIERQTAELDGRGVEVWLEQEPGSGGKESAEMSIRRLAGFIVHAETVSGAKEVRASPFAAQCEAGNVRLVQGGWCATFIEELISFPSGAHDDQVDAAAGAFNKLAAPRPAMSVLAQAAARGW